jgi:hypothetical protein
VLLTEELADTLRTSEAGIDLRMDWADAASLGFDGEQYFLVIVDNRGHLLPIDCVLFQLPTLFLYLAAYTSKHT